ncbi:cytoplasmic dynein 2 light intermediate chain 1-like isoform X2 [Acanthaster planci]|uniref:Cytoplasmic dynein 2 light intermediate chain 1-like isoform X2 n=1 Tax=Acanthaster planci TaxID=133434 RepID=A0A8B8A1Y1_ACAPL|nr:cytoplasmic dynein 2 light intermediate chain 1-like isoform X2 [Acanthaster planci]
MPVKMPQKGDNILWDLAIHEVEQSVQMEDHFRDQEDNEGTQAGIESTIILMGSKSATKDVAHIWELGGGTFLSELVEVSIKEENILSSSVMLILDLSHPNELWVTMEVLLKAALKRIEKVMDKLLTASPRIHEEIMNRSRKRFGDHPDLNMIDPFPLPLVIVGTKYDIFQDFDSEKRKIIGRTLRFVAHHYGATLQFCSSKHEGLMNRTKAQFGHLAFGAPLSINMKMANFDHHKPMMIPFGMDSLEQIGLPPMSEVDVHHLKVGTPMDLWKGAYTSFFPQQSVGNRLSIDDPARDTQYKEAAVDSVREQKDKDLLQYRNQVDLKLHNG